MSDLRNAHIHQVSPVRLKDAVDLGPIGPLTSADLEAIKEAFPVLFGLEFSQVSASPINGSSATAS